TGRLTDWPRKNGATSAAGASTAPVRQPHGTAAPGVSGTPADALAAGLSTARWQRVTGRGVPRGRCHRRVRWGEGTGSRPAGAVSRASRRLGGSAGGTLPWGGGRG